MIPRAILSNEFFAFVILSQISAFPLGSDTKAPALISFIFFINFDDGAFDDRAFLQFAKAVV